MNNKILAICIMSMVQARNNQNAGIFNFHKNKPQTNWHSLKDERTVSSFAPIITGGMAAFLTALITVSIDYNNNPGKYTMLTSLAQYDTSNTHLMGMVARRMHSEMSHDVVSANNTNVANLDLERDAAIDSIIVDNSQTIDPMNSSTGLITVTQDTGSMLGNARLLANSMFVNAAQSFIISQMHNTSNMMRLMQRNLTHEGVLLHGRDIALNKMVVDTILYGLNADEYSMIDILHTFAHDMSVYNQHVIDQNPNPVYALPAAYKRYTAEFVQAALLAMQAQFKNRHIDLKTFAEIAAHNARRFNRAVKSAGMKRNARGNTALMNWTQGVIDLSNSTVVNHFRPNAAFYVDKVLDSANELLNAESSEQWSVQDSIITMLPEQYQTAAAHMLPMMRILLDDDIQQYNLAFSGEIPIAQVNRTVQSQLLALLQIFIKEASEHGNSSILMKSLQAANQTVHNTRKDFDTMTGVLAITSGTSEFLSLSAQKENASKRMHYGALVSNKINIAAQFLPTISANIQEYSHKMVEFTHEHPVYVIASSSYMTTQVLINTLPAVSMLTNAMMYNAMYVIITSLGFGMTWYVLNAVKNQVNYITNTNHDRIEQGKMQLQSITQSITMKAYEILPMYLYAYNTFKLTMQYIMTAAYVVGRIMSMPYTYIHNMRAYQDEQFRLDNEEYAESM